MPRGDAQRDLETARSVRPGRRWPDHDREPTGNRTLKVDPRLEMDPRRFDADGWGRCEGLAFVPHDTGNPSKFRWWHRCRVCGTLLEASSREALERKWRQHGDAS